MKAYIPDDHDYRSKARLGRIVTVGSYLGLLAWFTLWHLFLIPAPTANPWVIWLIHMAPLLAFAHVIIKGSPRGHAWLCFVLLLLFIQAVLAASNPNTLVYGIGYTLLVSTLFTGAMMYTRWRARYNKQLAHWAEQEKNQEEQNQTKSDS
ncbi:DUF2069 domain-containing protein [Neptuniibacter sp.]|uniref:DUF2069 domain-containing protein n=1 Tax=Neptuniibacter sp. TaxID=1962643 RepID=UPI002623F156|nr:DUF2069 domain-containing protein [Neptuniibacter sp.]MCP4597894.1 DUF2069 domain-containing protein [Neptuniibacter sp.]